MSPAHLHQYASTLSPGQLSESLPASQVRIGCQGTAGQWPGMGIFPNFSLLAHSFLWHLFTIAPMEMINIVEI